MGGCCSRRSRARPGTGCSRSATSRRASTKASPSSPGTYDNLNAFERRVYLADALADPTRRVGTTDADGKPTPLSGQVFSARGIKARTDALALVSLYARRLADLAGTEAPAEFRTNVGVLGDNLTKLDDTFRQLSSGGAEPQTAARPRTSDPSASWLGSWVRSILNTAATRRSRRPLARARPSSTRFSSRSRTIWSRSSIRCSAPATSRCSRSSSSTTIPAARRRPRASGARSWRRSRKPPRPRTPR